MELETPGSVSAERRAPDVVAGDLVRLFGARFGGAAAGKYRISRKFLRQLAGRRKLSDAYVCALAEEMFERGYVLIACESYFIVLSQRQFASFRRVTAAAIDRVLSHEEANDDPRFEPDDGSDGRDARTSPEESAQDSAKRP